ncbi:MAG TPA: cupin domain-containing protein [Stellaceae bacterium]|nr:cupin domain-containing protein [Stellaceae bacterium]
MKYVLLVASVALGLALGTSAIAATKTITVTPDQVKWTDDKSLPPGWQTAVMAGDPKKKGAYALRVKIPPNAAFPAHKHPDVETITVISGSFGIGQGDSADKSKGQMLPAGSFYRLPAHTAHFAWTEAEGAVIQVEGSGPFTVQMIMPKKAAAKKS